MNKAIIITTAGLFTTTLNAKAQIKFSQSAQPIVKEEVFHYDSTRNFVEKDVKELKGQELYVPPREENLRQYGYMKFFDTYSATKEVYLENATYELYAGRTFIVEEVLPEPPESYPQRAEISVLKLRDKESGRECYYNHDSRFPHSYRFITMGFYEKEKSRYIGKQIVIKPGKNWRKSISEEGEPVYDFKTGLEVKIDPNEPWTIQELTVEDMYYTLSYVVTNSKGKTLTVAVIAVNDYDRGSAPCALHLNDTLSDIRKNQPKFYDAIMHSEIMLGMTPTMARYAWGGPDSEHKTSYMTTWRFRSGKYVDFKDGKLVAFR